MDAISKNINALNKAAESVKLSIKGVDNIANDIANIGSAVRNIGNIPGLNGLGKAFCDINTDNCISVITDMEPSNIGGNRIAPIYGDIY